MKKNITSNNLNRGSIVLGLMFFLAGIIILLLQVVAYLKYGYWDSCSVVYCWLPLINKTILDFYFSWVGLYKVLDYVPLSLFLMVFGMGMFSLED